MVGATHLPIICDADTGFGNALNVMRTTEEFIQAGAAGIHIEDQVAPKRCGHVAGKELISLEEAVGKFRAADRVRRELDSIFSLSHVLMRAVLLAAAWTKSFAGGRLTSMQAPI